ncbi:MAG TPA: hypothetical protein VMU80_17295 [Bryobacteraceae bacterium]|nr:hypothetical protein [Bryobacteraceae bacterium]
MPKKTTLPIAAALLTFASAVGMAQSGDTKSTPNQAKYFRLDFAVQELDGGKVTNSRHYVMSIETLTDTSSIRTGSKVPVSTGAGQDSQFTYIDVGVNIDCRKAAIVDGELALNVSADVSTAAPSPSMHPVIRQNRWTSNVIVPLGKPTVIFSSDDLTTKGQMQLELTATPIQAH